MIHIAVRQSCNNVIIIIIIIIIINIIIIASGVFYIAFSLSRGKLIYQKKNGDNHIYVQFRAMKYPIPHSLDYRVLA